MEQKDYKLEIIEILLKERTHIRDMARRLKTNHMIISRKVNDLLNENIVDLKKEGKNNVYYIKKTIEARSYAIIAEHYKLLKLLDKHPNLRMIIEKIKNDKRIGLAVLFGSYAKAMEKKESDMDIYIETGNKSIKEGLELLDSKINVKIGRYDKESNLIKEMEKNHIILKGAENYYEKNKFFS